MCLIGTNLYISVRDGMYVSGDLGVSWKKVTNGFAENQTVNAMAASGSTIFASAWEKGVYISKDNGVTWAEFSEGLPKKANVRSMLLEGNKLYAGVYGKGVYTYDVTSILGK